MSNHRSLKSYCWLDYVEEEEGSEEEEEEFAGQLRISRGQRLFDANLSFAKLTTLAKQQDNSENSTYQLKRRR